MGKRITLRRRSSACQLDPKQMELEPHKTHDFSISEKNYLEFFDFLKELHLTAGIEKPPQEDQ